MEFHKNRELITLLNAFSHIYYVIFGRVLKDNLKKFTEPTINLEHSLIKNGSTVIFNAIDYSENC